VSCTETEEFITNLKTFNLKPSDQPQIIATAVIRSKATLELLKQGQRMREAQMKEN